MDIFDNIKNNIIGKRVEQLKKQESQDVHLLKLKNKCPRIIVDFLLSQRRINRENTQKLHETSLFDIYNTMNENICIIDEFDTRIDHALSSKNPCDSIKSLLCFCNINSQCD